MGNKNHKFLCARGIKTGWFFWHLLIAPWWNPWPVSFFLSCFLPTYMFDYNKSGIKWNFMLPYILFSPKNVKKVKKLNYVGNGKGFGEGVATYAQILIIFRIYYYSFRTKWQKSFQSRGINAKILKTYWFWILLRFLFFARTEYRS